MSTTEADGVDDAVKGTLRVAMTAAARAGEHLAAMGAQKLRRAAEDGERAADELRTRHEAHRQAATAVLQDVHRSPGEESCARSGYGSEGRCQATGRQQPGRRDDASRGSSLQAANWAPLR